jgi:hypothetical protein
MPKSMAVVMTPTTMKRRNCWAGSISNHPT